MHWTFAATGSIYRPPNAPLLRALWSLLDGIWGIFKGSWRVLGYSTILASGLRKHVEYGCWDLIPYEPLEATLVPPGPLKRFRFKRQLLRVPFKDTMLYSTLLYYTILYYEAVLNMLMSSLQHFLDSSTCCHQGGRRL